MTELSTAEKIQAIEGSGLPIVWDFCHKVYFLVDDEHVADAVACGYTPAPASELRQFIRESCPLVFVSKYGLDNADFAHEWNIPQFTDDLHLVVPREGAEEEYCAICGKPSLEPVHDEECFK